MIRRLAMTRRASGRSRALVLARRRSALGLTAVAIQIGWFGVGVSAPAASSADPPPPVVGSPTTQHMTNPPGSDTSRPRLGWASPAAARGVAESKYQIRVTTDNSSRESRRDLVWDSGIVASGQSFDVPYGGPALVSQTQYYWHVRVWDNNGNASLWSQPAASFETAFLDPSQFR